MHAYDTFNFTYDGREFMASLYYDEDQGAPWENSDCHGIVSDWESRCKTPGELVLASDRSMKRFYDFAGTNKIAKRDNWGLSDEALAALSIKIQGVPTKGEIRAAAVQADYEYLRRWCNDDWHYCGVAVQALNDDGEPMGNEFNHALWGIESDCNDYLKQVALELAAEIKGI